MWIRPLEAYSISLEQIAQVIAAKNVYRWFDIGSQTYMLRLEDNLRTAAGCNIVVEVEMEKQFTYAM